MIKALSGQIEEGKTLNPNEVLKAARELLQAANYGVDMPEEAENVDDMFQPEFEDEET